ncbi:RHS repeat-associated core domain-containing protein [Curtobacterium sp. MCJR17_043]|uniref:RHS repeat-associated core domain-containing protein n=1 Tax=Curtobacterium sp. MCJR17_043 TaxID=2175660 RepID=UPI0032E8F08E
MEWLGARVYDPVAKGFLSTDPLAPVVGAGWSGNPYSYAGNDPLHAVDPLGLRPATDKDLQAYRDAHQGGLKDWADEHADEIAAVAVGVGIGLTIASMVTPVGPIVAIAMAAGAGAALSGGLSIQSNKGADGRVDWGAVGLDTVIGGSRRGGRRWRRGEACTVGSEDHASRHAADCSDLAACPPPSSDHSHWLDRSGCRCVGAFGGQRRTSGAMRSTRRSLTRAPWGT